MPEGMLLIDKPAGITSFGVVARVRRVLTEQYRQTALERGADPRQIPKKIKVGHAGTLDPFATGLLILLVGKATKQAGSLLKLDKTYDATVRLDATSTTGDPEGEVTPVQVTQPPTRAEVEQVCRQLTGVISQKVPAFSAVKINGERAYKLARQGRPVATPERQVEIYRLEILDYTWPELTLRCQVSSGTYIRTLGEDLGRLLGVGGYLTALRRLRIDRYDVADAQTLQTVMAHPEAARFWPAPTGQATGRSTEQPTGQATGQPTGQPAEQPTESPTEATPKKG